MNFGPALAAAANNGTPWLTVAGAIPLVGAIVVALLPVKFAKLTALAFSVVDLIWVIVMVPETVVLAAGETIEMVGLIVPGVGAVQSPILVHPAPAMSGIT